MAEQGCAEQPEAPVRRCQWPMWPDSAKPGRAAAYCGAQPEPGRPYCPEHCAVAYVRWEGRPA